MKLNTCDIVYGNYLAHFGILGMKWGVRRYQNKDGTLTEAGKKRYSVNTASKFNEAVNKQLASQRVRNHFTKLISDGSEDSKRLEEKRQAVNKSTDELNAAFDKYYKKYADKYGEWTGHRTEAHWELEKNIPNTRKFRISFPKMRKNMPILY